MNLSISAVNNNVSKNNVAFGMAKFTKPGMSIAKSCTDVYEPLSNPNHYQNPEFFIKKGLFSQAPFTKYIKSKLPANKEGTERAIDEVRDVILDCGTTKNSHTNACFVKQLLASKSHIEKLGKDTRTQVGTAVQEVFNKNWNNPELSKSETFDLLEMTRDVLPDLEYATLVGVIEKSDIY